MRAAYCPDTLTVQLRADAGPYDRAHELAHLDQDQRNDFLWRIRKRSALVPNVRHWTNLAVELQAALACRRTLRRMDRWDRHTAADMRAGLWSYVRALWRA